jgi:hypothetical protein
MASAPAPACASFLSSILAQGQNSFEDQDREAFVDVNGNNTFDVGDVLLGFVRLDNHTPVVNGVGPINNRIYAIFSQQVTGISGNVVQFGPTTALGLTISDLIGISAPAGSIVAVYSSFSPITDLITTSPGNLTGSSTTNLFDYFQAIKNGMSLTVIAGFGSGPTQTDDFFTATITSDGVTLGLTSPGNASSISSIPQSITVANFTAGLSILLNNDPEVIYNELVQGKLISGGPPPVFTLHDLVIKNGAVSGASDATNATEWGKVNPDLSYNNPGGFITDADFLVNVTVIPEPGMLAMLGSVLGLVGAMSARLGRRRS